MRFLYATSLLISLAVSAPAIAAESAREGILYKNPQCGCCEAYADYLRADGYVIEVVPTHDLASIKREHDVPEALQGCHTTLIGGYVVEGHVPLETLGRLLDEKPEIKGISLPGMPMGSPGMGGTKGEAFTIFEISEGTPAVYAQE